MRISDWSSDVCSSDLVGTADTFYLDGPAHRLQAVLDRLGAKSSFRFVPGRTHFDLYAEGEDKMALLKAIEIGRASCRERVCKYVSISGVAVYLKKKIQNK